jgi:RNA polymerase-binding transcription factor DksA
VAVDEAAVRERLEREREGVARELRNLDEGLSRSAEDETELETLGTHQADVATETFDRGMDETTRDNAEHLLRQYDEALGRLDAGTYGRCVVDGGEIEPERLEALPYVAMCSRHAAEAERR